MKGKLFVWLFSVILIGVFGTCCYLMTTVNPAPAPDTHYRRDLVVNKTYLRDSLSLIDNPDYGLEKIPEGVDADEFRKNLMMVTKYDLDKERRSYEPGQRVVPPIWPRDHVVERKDVNEKYNKLSFENLNKIEITSPLKGHRRSVNDNNLKENPGSILLKIVDDSGHKKIEINFISKESMKAKKLRKNRSSNYSKSNVTIMEEGNNQSTRHKDYDEENDKIIQVKADDVILLTIVDDSDLHLGNNVLFGGNSTDQMQELVMNITDFHCTNKTCTNERKVGNFEITERQLKEEILHQEMYNFNSPFNNDNETIDLKKINSQKCYPDPFISSKPLESINYTSHSNEKIPLGDHMEESTTDDIP